MVVSEPVIIYSRVVSNKAKRTAAQEKCEHKHMYIRK